MELDEAIHSRRSIRKYKPDPLPENLINQIIDAGQWAPSAHNRQLVEFIVVKEKPILKKLAILFSHGPFLTQAQVAIVIICDKVKTKWALHDGPAAVQNMLLKIHELGLGSCWLGPHNKEDVRTLLNIPENYEIITCLPIGYPDETPTKERNPPKVHHDKLGQP